MILRVDTWSPFYETTRMLKAHFEQGQDRIDAVNRVDVNFDVSTYTASRHVSASASETLISVFQLQLFGPLVDEVPSQKFIQQQTKLRMLRQATGECKLAVPCILAAFNVTEVATDRKFNAIATVFQDLIPLHEYLKAESHSRRDVWFKLFSDSLSLLHQLQATKIHFWHFPINSLGVRKHDGKIFLSQIDEAFHLDQIVSLDTTTETHVRDPLELQRLILEEKSDKRFVSPEYVLAQEALEDDLNELTQWLGHLRLLDRNTLYGLLTTFLLLLLGSEEAEGLEVNNFTYRVDGVSFLSGLVFDTSIGKALDAVSRHWDRLAFHVVERDALHVLKLSLAPHLSPYLRTDMDSVLYAIENTWKEMDSAFLPSKYAKMLDIHQYAAQVGTYLSIPDLVLSVSQVSDSDRGGWTHHLHTDILNNLKRIIHSGRVAGIHKHTLYYAILDTLITIAHQIRVETVDTLVPVVEFLQSPASRTLRRSLFFYFLYEIAFNLALEFADGRFPTSQASINDVLFDTRDKGLVFGLLGVQFSDNAQDFDVDAYRTMARHLLEVGFPHRTIYRDMEATVDAFKEFDLDKIIKQIKTESFPCVRSVMTDGDDFKQEQLLWLDIETIITAVVPFIGTLFVDVWRAGEFIEPEYGYFGGPRSDKERICKVMMIQNL